MSDKTTRNRLSEYTLGSAAILGMAGSAEAAVFHFQPELTAAAPTGLILSFNRAGEASASSLVSGSSFYFSNSYSIKTEYLAVGASSGALVDTEPRFANEIIGPGHVEPYSTGAALAAGGKLPPPASWSLGQRAYLGLRFDNAGTANYGWADITVVSYNTVTLHSFAYDDSGAPIAAGAVPEPAQISLLAAGATGVAAFFIRRRRKEALLSS